MSDDQTRDDEHERFTRLWTQAQPAISGYIAAVATDPHVADDVLQEVALALLRKFADYDPRRPFAAWAMGIAKMQLLSARRDRARAATRFREAELDQLAASWNVVATEADARQRALLECLRQVTGRARELLSLRYEHGLLPQAIATRLGMASGAARMALARVRGSLHDCVERRLAAERA